MVKSVVLVGEMIYNSTSFIHRAAVVVFVHAMIMNKM